MKRLIAFVLCAVIILSFTVAAYADDKKKEEIDLTGMTYDELVALKDRINLAIWESEDWQEVEVPHGVWVVGEDIPAGKWTVTVGNGCNLRFDMGSKLDATGTQLEKTEHWWRLKSSSRNTFDQSSDVESIDVELKDKTIITIDEGYVIFTPYSGKPSLGFKK